jgi:hypothetical protein
MRGRAASVAVSGLGDVDLDMRPLDGTVSLSRTVGTASTSTSIHAMLDREDLSTTALYTKVSDTRLAGAVAALPSFPSTPKTHCVHGHLRTPDNVLPAGDGCRERGRTRQRAYRTRVAGPGVVGPGSAPATDHGEKVERK